MADWILIVAGSLCAFSAAMIAYAAAKAPPTRDPVIPILLIGLLAVCAGAAFAAVGV